jgi:carbon storage regulator
MLVLTRKVGEVVAIGDDIRVTLVAVRGGTIRLGITAPGTVRVDRQEVRDQRTPRPPGKVAPESNCLAH